jgi:hypothetical protein
VRAGKRARVDFKEKIVMDDWQFTLRITSRQGDPIPQIPLSREDRRRLLGASIRLLAYRHAAGKRISKQDVSRIALFADPEPEVVGCIELVLGADGSSSGP